MAKTPALKKLLPRLVFVVFLLGGALLAGDTRRKAIRREMIEMDIAVRNLTSTIAMADKTALDDALQRLAVWQIKDHPELGAAFRAVLSDWQAKGLYRHGAELQKEAQTLRNFAATRPARWTDADWLRIASGLNRILMHCQNCHQAVQKEPK